ncbi:M23 family metallopeptidase [Nonomuraea indica]|uniref:murein hydrolase activator EnvC family protein n=1 Tax=Nonomuraea indica TaxID=1581193 RepID=UPI003183A93F
MPPPQPRHPNRLTPKQISRHDTTLLPTARRSVHSPARPAMPCPQNDVQPHATGRPPTKLAGMPTFHSPTATHTRVHSHDRTHWHAQALRHARALRHTRAFWQARALWHDRAPLRQPVQPRDPPRRHDQPPAPTRASRLRARRDGLTLPTRACPSATRARPATRARRRAGHTSVTATVATAAAILFMTAASFTRAGPAAADPAPWRWPLDGRPRVLHHFAPPPERWLAGHRGVDLAAPPGTPVLAAGSGVVRYAGPLAGRGVVSIEHPGGLRTTYLPVTASVRRGQQVTRGDRLGVVAASPSHCAESCLHWGLVRAPVYLDPLLLLGRSRVRLLPFWPAGQAVWPAGKAVHAAAPMTTSGRGQRVPLAGDRAATPDRTRPLSLTLPPTPRLPAVIPTEAVHPALVPSMRAVLISASPFAVGRIPPPPPGPPTPAHPAGATSTGTKSHDRPHRDPPTRQDRSVP